MKHLALIIIIILGSLYSVANASDAVSERYIKQLSLGGSHSIKNAAKSIYNTGMKNTEVLDVAAEVLMQRYPKATKADLDTLAWVAKAIGNSENPRYHNILKEVVDSDAHRKLRKYAKIALKQAGDPDENQYVKGTVNLNALRTSNSSSNTTNDKKLVAKVAKDNQSKNKQGLDIIVVGMSMNEVYDLVGHPTATTSHATGKAWNPFNYSRKDVARSISIYKGKGRVVFSHNGYSADSRVLEVIIDPDESGYP